MRREKKKQGKIENRMDRCGSTLRRGGKGRERKGRKGRGEKEMAQYGSTYL